MPIPPVRSIRSFVAAGLLLLCAGARAGAGEPAAPVAPLPAPGPVAASEPAPPAPDAAPDAWAAMREETFATVWNTVNESYFDPTFGGVDWAAERDKYRLKLPEATDKEKLRGLLQAMLGELRRTHFAIMPREAAVFTPAERNRIGTTGAEVVLVGDTVAVSEVGADSGAARAGLRCGDVIRRIGGLDLDRLGRYFQQAGYTPARCSFFLMQLTASRLHGPVGSKVALTVTDGTGAERNLEVPCAANDGPWSEPMGDFPSVPVACVTRPERDGIVYLRFNVFVRQVMKQIRTQLLAMPRDGGLVIDLRGNPGGITVMASGITGWLSDHAFLMGTMHLRQGRIGFSVAPQEGAFLGPVAVLIDRGSASTSEIMAAGLQEAGRARIFGENSAGAALPSLFKQLPTGDLLQYAIADLQTPDGVLIEGRGVIPDETVRRTREDLAAGRDPVLEAACRWLDAKRSPAAPTPGAETAASAAP